MSFPAAESDSPQSNQTPKGLAEGIRIFDRYRVKTRVEQGGTGIVWLAWDERLECDVALEFLPDLVRRDETSIEDLKKEIRNNLGLAHPLIARIHDLAMDSESAAIALEYVDGPTLGLLRLRQPHRVFKLAEIREWVRHLCEAIDYAHREARVVHGDLKPANLIISSAGRLKVAGFGISRSLRDSASRLGATRGDIGGSLPYMSPGLANGEPPSALDDIYSIGALVYELLTGRPPFYSGEIYQQIKSKVPPSMAERRRVLQVDIPDAIPDAWERAIASCLAKDPAIRPQSAGQLWQALNPPPPLPPDAVKAARSGGSRLPALLVTFSLLILLAAAGWWFGYELPRREAARIAAAEKAEAAAAQAKAAADLRERIDESQNLADLALKDRNWNQATYFVDKLADLDPENARIADLRKAISDGKTSEEREAKARAEAEAQRETEAAAQKKLRQLLKDARTALARKDVPSAFTLHSQAEEISPNDPDVQSLKKEVQKGLAEADSRLYQQLFGAPSPTPTPSLYADSTFQIEELEILDRPVGKKTFRITVKVRPGVTIDTDAFKTDFYIYENTPSGKLALTESVPSIEWTSAPVDWENGATETFEIQYTLPKDKSRTYAAYVLYLYYKNKAQAGRTDSRDLAELLRNKTID